jgi:hypothetical protein
MLKTSNTIPEPPIGKYPTEVFGYPYSNRSGKAQEAFDSQYCPFLKSECKKPRKSQPHIKVGICSVGYKGTHLSSFQPIIICPHRLISQTIFRKVAIDFLGTFEKIRWANEVSMGVGGSVDYVATQFNERGQIDQFLCIEFQAAGTTGTPYPAINDLKASGKFLRSSYQYGINWANEFLKTMMQQVLKKGAIIEGWNEKIVFVMQDVGLGYIRSVCDCTDLHPSKSTDPIHFYTFSLVWNNRSAWNFRFKEKVSTNTAGIKRIIAGAVSADYPSPGEFKSNILRKLGK